LIVINQPLPWMEFIFHNSCRAIELVVCIETFYKRHPPSFERLLTTLCSISYLNGGSSPPWRNSFVYITTFASREIHLLCIRYRIKTQRSLHKPCWPFNMWLSASHSHVVNSCMTGSFDWRNHWTYQSRLIPPIFMKVSVPSWKSERLCVHVCRDIVITCFILEFGNVLTNWYVFTLLMVPTVW